MRRRSHDVVEHLVARALQLAAQVADAFAEAARDPAVADLESTLPARLVDLVARRARRCTAALSSRDRSD